MNRKELLAHAEAIADSLQTLSPHQRRTVCLLALELTDYEMRQQHEDEIGKLQAANVKVINDIFSGGQKMFGAFKSTAENIGALTQEQLREILSDKSKE